MTDEEHRHKCEVRYWIKIRKEKGLQEFRRLISIYDLGIKRPTVMRDIQDQYIKGNRGEKGDWK
jgi:tRNA A-37 threonylcarbamoyl transferase component Bud32